MALGTRPRYGQVMMKGGTARDGGGMAIGIAVGVALGVAMDNIAVGIAIGVAIGAGITETRRRRGGRDE